MAPDLPLARLRRGLAWDRPAPLLGEHNEYLYREVLRNSEGDFERIKESGMIGTDFALGES